MPSSTAQLPERTPAEEQPPAEDLPELVTVRDVAELCHVKPGTVYEWVATGKIPYYKLGGTSASSIRFNLADVLAWLEAGRRETAAP
jgi:excisionase family DNA binding protein